MKGVEMEGMKVSFWQFDGLEEWYFATYPGRSKYVAK